MNDPTEPQTEAQTEAQNHEPPVKMQGTPESYEVHVEQRLDEAADSIVKIGKLAQSIKQDFGDHYLNFDMELKRIIDMHSHALSTLPGAANPVESAMNIIGKMADIARNLKNKELVDFIVQSATLSDSVLICMNAGLRASSNASMALARARSCEAQISNLSHAFGGEFKAYGEAFALLILDLEENGISVHPTLRDRFIIEELETKAPSIEPQPEPADQVADQGDFNEVGHGETDNPA